MQDEYGPPPPPPSSYLAPSPVPSLPQGQYVPPPPPQVPQQQYLPPLQQNSINFHQQSNGFEHHHSASEHQYQTLPLQQPHPRFTAQAHDCGQGPNLVGASYQFQQQQQQFGNSAGSVISQSIPVAEQHTQFIATGPSNSYVPAASGNAIDHEGYASQKNEIKALPDGTDPQSLPGLDGLNVISAQKSESIHLTEQQAMAQSAASKHTFQLQASGNSAAGGQNHDEILSESLLQSILTAIEQPQSKNSNSQQTAQNRSDDQVHDDEEDSSKDQEDDHETGASQKVEVKAVHPSNDDEEQAVVTELKPIVAKELDDTDDEAKH